MVRIRCFQCPGQGTSLAKCDQDLKKKKKEKKKAKKMDLRESFNQEFMVELL